MIANELRKVLPQRCGDQAMQTFRTGLKIDIWFIIKQKIKECFNVTRK